MKLLYLVPKFDVFGKPHGGTAHVRGSLKEMKKYFESIDVICKRSKEGDEILHGESVTKDGVFYYRSWIPSIFFRNKTDPISAIFSTLLDAIEFDLREHYDIIYERYEFSSGAGSILKILSLFRKKLILEVNSPHIDEGVFRGEVPKLLAPLLRLFEYFQFALADKIVTTTTNLIPDIFQNKVYETEWSGGENLDWKAKPSINLKNRSIVAYLGSASYWHGFEDFVAAADEINKRRKDVYFLLIGPAGTEETYKKIGWHKNFIWAGIVLDKELSSLLASAKICVAPFNSKNYPPLQKYGFYWSSIKLWDYMAIGKPIISTKIAQRIVTPDVGVCVEAGNTKDLAKAIEFVVDNPEYAKHTGENARAKWEKNTWAVNIEKLYNAVIE